MKCMVTCSSVHRMDGLQLSAVWGDKGVEGGWAVKVWDRCVDNVTLASAVKVVGMGLIQQVRKHSSFALSDELRGIPVL